MMKNKIMIGLLLAGAGFGQDVQAMVFTRNFIVQLATVGVVSGSVSASYAMYEEEKKIVPESIVQLNPESEKKVRELFKRNGFPLLKLLRYEDIRGASVGQYADGTVRLSMGDLEASVLAHTTLDICRTTRDEKGFRSQRWAINEDMIQLVFGHEIEHLKNNEEYDVEFVDQVRSAYESLWSIHCDDSVIKHIKEYAGFLKKVEERCDKHACYNVAGENADLKTLAQSCEGLVHYLSFLNPHEEQALNKSKSIIDPLIKHLGIEFHQLLDHPLFSVRIAYLTELAAEFRRKKDQQLCDQGTVFSKVGFVVKQQCQNLGRFFFRKKGGFVAPSKVEIDPIKIQSIFADARI